MTPRAPEIAVEYKTTPEFKETYANHLGVKFTGYDFAIELGMFEVPTPGKLVVTNYQRVFMSPATARSLLEVLANMVNTFEQNHGPIKKTEVGKISFDAARNIPEGSRQ